MKAAGRVVAIAAVLWPGMAAADFYLEPSMTISEMYDDNIFYTPTLKEDDFISRFTPAVATGYEAETWGVDAVVDFDSEVYMFNQSQNTAFMREHGSLDLWHQPMREMMIGINADYTGTNTPGELNIPTDFTSKRANASRFAVGPRVSYRFSSALDGAASYSYTMDRLADQPGINTHEARLAFNRVMTPRDTLHLYYTDKRFEFETDGTESVHTPMLGWSRNFTPTVNALIAAGPRFTTGDADGVDAMVQVTKLFEQGSASLNYARTLTTVLGQVGSFESDTIDFAFTYAPYRRWEMRLVPAYTRFEGNEGNEIVVDIYQVNFAAGYKWSEDLSLVGTYSYSLQKGDFLIPDQADVSRHAILFGVDYQFEDGWFHSLRKRRVTP